MRRHRVAEFQRGRANQQIVDGDAGALLVSSPSILPARIAMETVTGSMVISASSSWMNRSRKARRSGDAARSIP